MVHSNWRYLTIATLLCWGMMMSSFARIGETPAECNQRYGEAVRTLPGYGSVAGALVYQIDDMYISAIFGAERGGVPRVQMVVYSRVSDSSMTWGRRVTPEERGEILATVPGRWESYGQQSQLAGGRQAVRSISTQQSPIETRRDKSKAALEKAIQAILPKLQSHQYRIQDIGYIGSDIFSFEVINGVAIASFSAADAVIAWAEQIIKEREPEQEQPSRIKF